MDLLTLEEVGLRARSRLPAEVLDPVEGGAGQERNPAANRREFDHFVGWTRVLTVVRTCLAAVLLSGHLASLIASQWSTEPTA